MNDGPIRKLPMETRGDLTADCCDVFWGTSTMRLTPLARRARHLRSVLLVTALAVATSAVSQDSSMAVLDLTAPPSREEQGVKGSIGPGIPGSRVGGIGGIGRIPRPYALPLLVQLQSLLPQRVTPGEKFTVEIVLSNPGTAAYYLPASQKAMTVRKQGN